jgi:hypothetical protein
MRAVRRENQRAHYAMSFLSLSDSHRGQPSAEPVVMASVEAAAESSDARGLGKRTPLQERRSWDHVR